MNFQPNGPFEIEKNRSRICPDVLSAVVNHGACVTPEMFTTLDKWVRFNRNSEVVQRFVKHYQNGEIRQIERLEI